MTDEHNWRLQENPGGRRERTDRRRTEHDMTRPNTDPNTVDQLAAAGLAVMMNFAATILTGFGIGAAIFALLMFAAELATDGRLPALATLADIALPFASGSSFAAWWVSRQARKISARAAARTKP